MKIIKLSQGKFAIIDNEDFERINQYKWYLSHYGYAVRTAKKTRQTIWMHREINNTPEGMRTDHINRNPLDNRKSNLRTCKQGQNVLNRIKSKNYGNPYKGVSKHTQNSKWRARIMINQKEISLGCYDTPEEAALSYNKAAKEHFGEFARLNQI